MSSYEIDVTESAGIKSWEEPDGAIVVVIHEPRSRDTIKLRIHEGSCGPMTAIQLHAQLSERIVAAGYGDEFGATVRELMIQGGSE